MGRSEDLRRCLTFAPAILLAATAATASQVRPVNLEQMTQRAARIFAGRCVRVEAVDGGALGHAVTVATFEVERAVKGEIGPTVSVRMLGGDAAFGRDTPGLPSFRPGDQVVLFLYGESELGLSAPVGLGQGRFQVVTDKSGRRLALNDFGNRQLLRGLTPAARTRLEQARGATFETIEREDLEVPALLDLVAALASGGP